MDYKERMNDQEEIKQFTDNIFNSGFAGCDGKRMNYKQFEYINKTISSEMFYSLMAILHEKLPCSKNHFRLKKKFRDLKQAERNGEECSSPVKVIASPNIIKGLSIGGRLKGGELHSASPTKQATMERGSSLNSGNIGSKGSTGSLNNRLPVN